jgi:hypothetical protein
LAVSENAASLARVKVAGCTKAPTGGSAAAGSSAASVAAAESLLMPTASDDAQDLEFHNVRVPFAIDRNEFHKIAWINTQQHAQQRTVHSNTRQPLPFFLIYDAAFVASLRFSV